jgi:hypothetical protein
MKTCAELFAVHTPDPFAVGSLMEKPRGLNGLCHAANFKRKRNRS